MAYKIIVTKKNGKTITHITDDWQCRNGALHVCIEDVGDHWKHYSLSALDSWTSEQVKEKAVLRRSCLICHASFSTCDINEAYCAACRIPL